MNNRQNTRGLTLIEVLLAVTLLAMLAGISVGILRDAAAASNVPDTANKIDTTARVVDTSIEKHTRELWELAVGQSWTPPLEAQPDQGTIRYTRQPCEDCPEGWGRLHVTIDGLSLTRFHTFKPESEAAP